MLLGPFVNIVKGFLPMGRQMLIATQLSISPGTERPLFWQINSQWKHGTCSVIRKGNHKLIQWLSTGKLELYNLKTDATESENIADAEIEITKNMLAELVEWRKSKKVPLPPNSVLDF